MFCLAVGCRRGFVLTAFGSSSVGVILVLMTMITMTRVGVFSREKLLGVAPLLLLASSREHGGNGKEEGGDLGLHVG